MVLQGEAAFREPLLPVPQDRQRKECSSLTHHQNNNDSQPFDFTEDSYKQIEAILSKFPPNQKRSASIPVLMLAQK